MLDKSYDLPQITILGKRTKQNGNNRYLHMPYTGSIIGLIPVLPKTKKSRQEDAAFLSAIGNTIGNFIPFIGDKLSIVSSIPDILYDSLNVIESSNNRNTSHLLLDALGMFSSITPTKYDNFIKILNTEDDLMQSLGHDIFDWINNKILIKNK